MNRALILLAATFFAVLIVTLISTSWVFIPALADSSEASHLVNQALFFVFWAALITGFVVVAIGIPVYLVLDRKGKASQKNLSLVGFIIPIIIFFIITFITTTDGNGTFSSGQNYYGTYRAMVVENERTFWGWVSLIEQFFTFGIYGLIGATTFGKVVSILSKQQEKA